MPDPLHDGRMSVFWEALEILASKLKGEYIIRGPGAGLFSLAGNLMGLEKILMEIAMLDVDTAQEKENALKHLMDCTTEALISFQKALSIR